MGQSEAIITHFAQDPNQLLEACLSSSYFNDWPWKQKVLSIAEQVLEASHHTQEYILLQTRISIRKAQLARLYNHAEVEIDPKILPLPPNDLRSTALLADIAILNSQKFVDRGNLLAAVECLPAAPGNDLSALEKTKSNRILLVRGCIYRFSGEFLDAYRVLSQLPPNAKAVSHLGAVMCEIGDYDRAIERLVGQLQLTHRSRGINRLKLAVADAHLCKCMQAAKLGHRDELAASSAKTLYLELHASLRPITRADGLQAFSIQVGLAVLHHLEGHPAAKRMWHEALDASKACGLAPGYTDVIAYYSLSILARKYGDLEDSMIFQQKAATLARKTGRQHYFTALGSIWPDILGRQADSYNLPRITFN